MKRVRIIALVLAAVLVLGACGTTIESKYTGTWEAKYCEYLGLVLDISEILDGGCTLELKDTGYCTFSFNGDSASAKWAEIEGGVRVNEDEEMSFYETEDGFLSFETQGITIYLEKIA